MLSVGLNTQQHQRYKGCQWRIIAWNPNPPMCLILQVKLHTESQRDQRGRRMVVNAVHILIGINNDKYCNAWRRAASYQALTEDLVPLTTCTSTTLRCQCSMTSTPDLVWRTSRNHKMPRGAAVGIKGRVTHMTFLQDAAVCVMFETNLNPSSTVSWWSVWEVSLSRQPKTLKKDRRTDRQIDRLRDGWHLAVSLSECL